MDKIIYIEADEEITSVIDKLKSVEGKEIILVVPKEATVLQSIVNLKLLKMEADTLKKEVAIVTADKVGQNLASQVGIPILEDTKSARPIIVSSKPQPPGEEEIVIDLSKQVIPLPKEVKVHHFQERQIPPPSPFSLAKKEKVSFKKPWKKLLISLSILIFLLLVFSFLPYTILALKIETSPFEKEVTVYLDKNVTEVQLAKSTAPATLVEKELELAKDFSSTGKKEVGEKTKGSVSIYNKTGDVVTVASSSKLRSEAGLIFISLSKVEIPAATASVDSFGNVVVSPGKADVQVEASEPGTKYNITASRFTILDLPSAKQANVYGQSTSTFSGGTSKQVTVVSSDDLENAKKQLSSDILQSFKEEIKKEKADLQFLEDAILSEILSFQSQSEVGTEASTFKAQMKSQAKTLAFRESDFRLVVLEKAKEDISPDSMLLVTAQDEIVTTLKNKDLEKGTMEVSGKIKTRIGPKLEIEKLKKQILGKSISKASTLLQSQSGIQQVQFQIYPSFWLKRLPLIKYDIKVKLEYQ